MFTDLKDKSKTKVQDEYHGDFDSWDMAVRDGCRLCLCVRDAMPTELLELLDDKCRRVSVFGDRPRIFSSTMYLRLDVEGCPDWIVVSISKLPANLLVMGGNHWLLNLKLKGTGVSEPSYQLLIPVVLTCMRADVEPKAHVREPHPWDCATKWLHSCITSHHSCRLEAYGGGQWYPTRLLDLGDPSEKPCAKGPVRLIDTHHTSPHGPYLTLSHRWGSSKPVLTTTQNLEDFMRQVPQLPRTFSDAILVTRRLGIRYLWIDSLCIIQDSPLDWAKEAALMGNVYLNAFCNIAATNSTDNSDGLFLSDRPRLALPVVIQGGELELETMDRYRFTREVAGSLLQKVSTI